MTAPTAVNNSVAPLQFEVPSSPLARVLHQIRVSPGTTRSQLKNDLGLSQPTVARLVTRLSQLGLVEERHPGVDTTQTGRPSARLEVDGRHIVTWGAHVGVRRSVILVCDGAGRTIRQAHLDLDATRGAPETLSSLSRSMFSLAAGLPEPAAIGVAFSSPVDHNGHLTSPEFGWPDVPVGALLADAYGRHVDVATGVTAVAATELLSRPLPPEGATETATLFFYARNVVTHAWMFSGAVHRPRAPRHRPDSSVPLTNGDVVRNAQKDGLDVSSFGQLTALASSCPHAEAILQERAYELARTILTAVDVLDPGTLVLAGEAFTAHPATLKTVVRHVRGHLEGRCTLRIQRASPGTLPSAARMMAVYRLWNDPARVVA
ncbi:ROK family transcriptional regulator [Corynebacterium capitovis]|uniref:ROK family transcriptional regulator n=1 Tax=Corynebacterium capitovis TaxID=131081 RepID=UPI00037F277D|nr:ROK family transcriptional regulator [Corynebacterium capitovis]